MADHKMALVAGVCYKTFFACRQDITTMVIMTLLITTFLIMAILNSYSPACKFFIYFFTPINKVIYK
jgi:hypothetical protein